jgi:hypothetical protein
VCAWGGEGGKGGRGGLRACVCVLHRPPEPAPTSTPRPHQSNDQRVPPSPPGGGPRGGGGRARLPARRRGAAGDCGGAGPGQGGWGGGAPRALGRFQSGGGPRGGAWAAAPRRVGATGRGAPMASYRPKGGVAAPGWATPSANWVLWESWPRGLGVWAAAPWEDGAMGWAGGGAPPAPQATTTTNFQRPTLPTTTNRRLNPPHTPAQLDYVVAGPSEAATCMARALLASQAKAGHSGRLATWDKEVRHGSPSPSPTRNPTPNLAGYPPGATWGEKVGAWRRAVTGGRRGGRGGGLSRPSRQAGAGSSW